MNFFSRNLNPHRFCSFSRLRSPDAIWLAQFLANVGQVRHVKPMLIVTSQNLNAAVNGVTGVGSIWTLHGICDWLNKLLTITRVSFLWTVCMCYVYNDHKWKMIFCVIKRLYLPVCLIIHYANTLFNKWRPQWDGPPFANAILTYIFSNETPFFLIAKFVSWGPDIKMSPLVQVMVWRRTDTSVRITKMD